MVADDLPLVAGEVDEPRAAPRRAAAAHRDDRVAAGEPEHRREVVLRADGPHAGRAAEDVRHLAPREQPDEVEAVHASVQQDAATRHGRVVEPGQRRRLEALIQDDGAQRADCREVRPDGADHGVPAERVCHEAGDRRRA